MGTESRVETTRHKVLLGVDSSSCARDRACIIGLGLFPVSSLMERERELRGSKEEIAADKLCATS